MIIKINIPHRYQIIITNHHLKVNYQDDYENKKLNSSKKK